MSPFHVYIVVWDSEREDLVAVDKYSSFFKIIHFNHWALYINNYVLCSNIDNFYIICPQNPDSDWLNEGLKWGNKQQLLYHDSLNALLFQYSYVGHIYKNIYGSINTGLCSFIVLFFMVNGHFLWALNMHSTDIKKNKKKTDLTFFYHKCSLLWGTEGQLHLFGACVSLGVRTTQCTWAPQSTRNSVNGPLMKNYCK